MPEESQAALKRPKRRLLVLLIAASLTLLLGFGAYTGYVYTSSPAVIRNPQMEHYHFRLQVLVDGKAENFGSKAYQTGYSKDQCSGSLAKQPIHFHDNKDQLVHIHWEGMTGGMVLKYYGWNYIAGIYNALGYKLDDLGDIQKVAIHGNLLPSVPKDANFYVYIGDEKGYQQKSFDDFKHQDLETFFGKTSNSPAHELNKRQTTLLDWAFPKAYAHGDEVHSATTSTLSEEQLTRINNLIGNVVIFVQKDKPTDQQITDRFNKLEPLSDSTCGG